MTIEDPVKAEKAARPEWATVARFADSVTEIADAVREVGYRVENTRTPLSHNVFRAGGGARRVAVYTVTETGVFARGWLMPVRVRGEVLNGGTVYTLLGLLEALSVRADLMGADDE